MQAAVRTRILSLIVLDAAVVYGAAGPRFALLVLLLIVPTLLLSRRISPT